MAAPSRSLPLSQVYNGDTGRDFEDLRWYFTEGQAAQSGLKSSQSSFERKMLVGISEPPSKHEYDGRLVAHISRAREIEKKLAVLRLSGVSLLCHFFRSVLPVLETNAVGKADREVQKVLNRKYGGQVALMLRAYHVGA